MTLLQHCYPNDIFSEPKHQGGAFWACVRVRPRWEKKFSRWLLVRQMPHFLPLITRRTVSHRKVRETTLPLFPGYVFVPGISSKQPFASSGCVVRVLLSRSEQDACRLANELKSLHHMLVSGIPVVIEQTWVAGERLRVLDGPLSGVTGTVVKDGGQGRLVVWIEMLGMGTAVTLPPGTPLEALKDQ